MTLKEKLNAIQCELKAPKNLRNTFGNYNYRNAEGILEAVKPFLKEQKVIVTITDDVLNVENRIYVKATVTIHDIESQETLNVSALARESDTKKGMDDSQITGTASSYARKYALNGLFLLDDTKDADTDEYANQTKKANKANDNAQGSNSNNNNVSSELASEPQKKAIFAICAKHKVDVAMLYASNGITEDTVTKQQATQLIQSLKKKFGE